MKTKISRFSKSVLSVILAMTLIMSTMLIGTLTTSAVTTTNSSFTQGDTIYLYLGDNTKDWADDTGWSNGANIGALFYYQDNINYSYTTGTKHALEAKTDTDNNYYNAISERQAVSSYVSVENVSGNYYKVTVPNGTFGAMRFIRVSTSQNNNTYDLYNYSALMYANTKGTNNCVNLTGWDNSSTWSTYGGGSTTTQISSWSFTGYQANVRDDWSFDSTPDITGETGFYEFDTKKSDGNLESSTIYFRMVGHTSDSNNYVMSNSSGYSDGVVLSQETKLSDNSARGNGTEMNFTPSRRYVKFTIGKNSSNQYTLTITQSDTSSVTTTYTVTAGTCTGGSVTVGGSTSSVQVASGGKIPVVATHSSNHEFVKWVANPSDCVTFDDATSATTNATITGNATITATFRSTSTPTQKFYFEYYTSDHNTVEMTYNNGSYSYETNFNYGNFKFRITSLAKGETGFDPNNASDSVSAYKRQNQKGSDRYVTVTASGVSLVTDSGTLGTNSSYGVTEFADIMLTGIDTSKTYVVTYTPGDDNILNGTITVSDKSVTPTLATPKIKGDSSALPGSTITVALDNQKDFGTDTDGDKVFVTNDDSIKFAYTVTASDNSTVAFTESASGKITKADGTAINDKISFTASNLNGVTYTITCKVSADGFDDVTSSELTVKVGTIPYAQADRIYAYAKTLGADETPALNAWVASESKVGAINTHNDSGNVKPTLGRTSDTNIRIFLPTTASSDKVVLYNSFSSNINVKDKDGNYVTITAGDYAEVSYTPNASTTVKSVDSSFSDKTLTIYKSTADGALYVNNTGDYASIENNGALSMINQLYSNKEKGEIAAGNAGALADSNGVQDVAVKKIKGRGNSTWVSANKKSFNVTFTDNIKAFGFKQGKKFSLLANFKDPSLSRNKILYELADLMGVKYSPDAATVDLYMNGLYMGSYLMCQKVEVGSKELVNDLGKTLLEDLYTDSASGKVPESAKDTIKSRGFSFLMELDSNAGTGDFYITVASQKITIKEPEYLNDDGSIPTDDVTKAAQEFVRTKYTELNTAMSNTSITLENLNKIIDVESLAKYYLINEIAKNYDIGVSSTYLVYNYTKGKFYISPLWDMDVTTGNCKATDTNYQSYEGNWTDNTDEGTGNKFMALVFNNPQVQSAARKLWTGSYYTTLTNYIDTLTTKATSVEGSLNCNYTKWNYPYGFQGTYRDNVQPRTSLKKATYNPADNSYTVASSSSSYDTTAVGQTTYVSDWLKSRAAWMSHKYNTYTLTGLNGWNSEDAVTKSSDNGVTTWKLTSNSSTNAFKISTDGYAGRDMTHACINYDTSVNIVNDSSVATISAASGTNMNFGFMSTGTISESSPVYLIYNQKTNTLTLSDKETTSANPSVTLSGSAVASEDIKDGTAVTLTAKINPATSNNVVVKGDYTATLYIGEKKVTAKTVTFTAADDTKDVVFDTHLEGTNQTYKVVVTCNDGEQDLTGTSNTFTYKQTGIKDQKIYFDPSTYVINSVSTWLNKISENSTVTVTIKDSNSTQLATFKMYIDSEDVYGLAKGVFRADIDETTLGYLKVPTNTIHFELDGESISTDSDRITINGDANIESGWIYNYSTQTSDNQRRWEQYNVSYVEAYPSSRTDSNYSNITTFAQFKDYISAQKAAYDKGEATDNIVYFDNSVSKWYNVYIYGWGGTGPTKDAVIMKKLPYADIWYYDFGTDSVTSSFLFKDRSSYGFGNNYQETVDLVDGYIKNGDGADVRLFFETTLRERANPIFVTQNFYNSTVKVSENSDKTLKYRAFNTQWDEFATILSNTVQTKAVDVYFDLHDKATDVTNIQLYHSSTNYTFASEFTRLTQLPNSTIFHAAILLPYTDNGIAFKFDKFVVNYSDGSTKTCAMSANVQPTFTCINTGEVWYEINSDFANLGYDTAVSSASLLKANSPLLAAGSSDKVYFDNSTFNWSNVYVYFYSGAYWSSKGTGSKTNAGSQDDGTAYSGTCMNEGGAGYTMTDSDGDGIFEYSLDGFTGATCIAFTNTSQKGYEFFYGNSVQVVYRGDLATNISSGTTLYTPSNTLNDTLNGAVKYYNNGSWSAYDPAPATTDYYVTGTGTLVNAGADWNVNYEGDKLVSNGDGTYSITYTNKDYNDNAGYYAFKITTGAWHEAGGTEYAYGDLDTSSSSGASFSTPSSDIGSGNIQIVFNTQETSDITITFNPSAAEGERITVAVTKSGSAPTPTISLSPASTSLTLVDGTATTTLTTTKTNADGATVTYTVNLPTGTVSADGTTFTATAAGTYVVTATIEGTTATDQVTITVSEPVTTDYCGVLAYNHSTATFDVTGGGTIDSTDVVLTNGYYNTGDVTTGYTSYDGTTYTVIYALPSTASSGATTSYSSTTRHTDSNYEFNDWTKNGIVKSTVTALSDEISGTSTVAYVANWSLVKKVSYTFTYKYYEFDTTKGMAYAEGRATILNEGYVIQVTLPEGSSNEVIKAAYLANAPKLESDYYIYTFDGVDISVNGLYASAIANNDTIRYYTVRFDNGDTTTVNNYYYQHVAELSYDGDVPEGQYVAWKNENGEILHYGTTYKFRVTRNIDIKYEFVNSDSVSPATYVNEPTYEFYINNTGKEYVRFNILVENVLADLSIDNVEFGTLYFFTDSTGKPNDSTISVEADLDPNTLITVSEDGNLNVKSGVGQHNVNTVSSEYKYIYAPKMPNTSANVDRYVRVYSYIAVKDDNGKYTNVIVSNSYALASIRDALNKS